MNEQRLPPQSQEAEISVLGSMIRSNPCIGEVLQIVQPKDFYADAHQKICLAIFDLNDQGKPVDLVTLADELNNRNQMADVGAGKLGDVFDAAPTAANAVWYARIVRDKSIIRQLIHYANEIAGDAWNQVASAEEMLETAERKILAIAQRGISGQTVDIQTMIRNAYDRIDQRRQKGGECLRGISTGFVELDYLTSGLQDSELILVAARPSVGKTAFILCVLRHVLIELGLPVFFVSLEQTTEELSDRLLCSGGLVDSHKLRCGLLANGDYERLLQSGRALSAGKAWFRDSPSESMLKIAAEARRLKAEHDIKLICIDYLLKRTGD